MNLNHSRFILITHRKFHQNQSSRLGDLHTHTDGDKKYNHHFGRNKKNYRWETYRCSAKVKSEIETWNLGDFFLFFSYHMSLLQNKNSKIYIQNKGHPNLYIYIPYVRLYACVLLLNGWTDFDEIFYMSLRWFENGLDSQFYPIENVLLINLFIYV